MRRTPPALTLTMGQLLARGQWSKGQYTLTLTMPEWEALANDHVLLWRPVITHDEGEHIFTGGAWLTETERDLFRMRDALACLGTSLRDAERSLAAALSRFGHEGEVGG